MQFVIETGRPISEIARELESGEGTLGNWVNEWKQSNPEPEKALTPVERARVAEMEDSIRRLRLENEFLKKCSGLLRKDATAAERCALIKAEKANYPIAWICGLLRIPRSSFCEWRGRVVTATAARRGERAVLVGEAFEEFRQAYGYRRIARVLNARGHACDVLRCIKDLGQILS